MKNDGTNLLWYKKSARNRDEALPLGNGRLGAMVWGGARHERISLNEDTLWSGYPHFYENKNAADVFRRARELALSRRYPEAERLLEEDFTHLWTQIYLPLGDLRLDMEHGDEVENYTRTLDISRGIHLVEYDCDGVHYTRECFASAPDGILVMRLTADRPAALSLSLHLQPALLASVSYEADGMAIEGHCPVAVREFGATNLERGRIVYGERDEERGMGYYAKVCILPENGKIRRSGGVTLEGADAVTLLFNARTSFNGWDKHPVLEGCPYREPCRKELEAAAKSYDELKAAHVADHTALYNRIRLELYGGEERLLPTDERLFAHEAGRRDLSLYALLFNYGRYLTIAASREGTQATTLQGIWNDDAIPPWNSNYTTNINTEMNYWPTLAIDLPECYRPLLLLIGEVAKSGKRTAREYYGAPGFVLHHNTDLWRMTTPPGGHRKGCACFAIWPLGSGWLIRHLHEYYEHTQDTAWLEREALPVMREAALFYEAMLAEDHDGSLIMAPSTSPENRFVTEDGQSCAVSASTAMTQAILRDVFEIYLSACRTLGKEDALAKRLTAILPRLGGFGIGREGELLEWAENVKEAEPHHRHISHLYGLHPAHQITPHGTPELANACRTSLERRGDESTGWAMGWRINQWARLRDGDRAERLLDMQLRPVVTGKSAPRRGGTYLNLLDAHPPFQIDGNFGACAGICEMLLQTKEDGTPDVLPALPTDWRRGGIYGICTRFGQKLDIVWDQDEGRIDVDMHPKG